MKKIVTFMLLLLLLSSMSISFIQTPALYAAGSTKDTVGTGSGSDSLDLTPDDDDPLDYYSEPIFCPPR